MSFGVNLAGARLASYARYSSDNQSDASIDDQERVVSDYAIENNGSTAIVKLSDRAVSASSLVRAGFEKLIALARAGQIDVILTENTDRISRDFADSAFVFRELRFLNVRLIGVSNGFDSFAPHAQIQLALEGWKNEQYIADLRFKTRRGQEGRIRKGYSAGGLAIGYTTVSACDEAGEEVGRSVVIEPARAAIVVRIFELYRDGNSLDAVAKLLNAEGVEPARRGKYKFKGWNSGTVRTILRNPVYIGEWSWGKKKWHKLPGTNIRRNRPAGEKQIIRQNYPERRIIDAELWDAVQARLAQVRNHYTKNADGTLKGMAKSGKKTSYPLSSLLYCSECGHRMIIYGGTGPVYYRCSRNKKTGLCKNRLSLREDRARVKVLAALKARFSTPDAIADLRQKVAKWLGEKTRQTNDRLTELQTWLDRTNQRIGNITRAAADGDFSPSLRDALKALEKEKAEVEALIGSTTAAAETPVRLPSPDEIVASALALEGAFEHDPNGAREALSHLFEDGRLVLHPTERGYVARSRVFLLGFGGGGGRGGARGRSPVGSVSSTQRSAPAQRPLEHDSSNA